MGAGGGRVVPLLTFLPPCARIHPRSPSFPPSFRATSSTPNPPTTTNGPVPDPSQASCGRRASRVRALVARRGVVGHHRLREPRRLDRRRVPGDRRGCRRRVRVRGRVCARGCGWHLRPDHAAARRAPLAVRRGVRPRGRGRGRAAPPLRVDGEPALRPLAQRHNLRGRAHRRCRRGHHARPRRGRPGGGPARARVQRQALHQGGGPNGSSGPRYRFVFLGPPSSPPRALTHVPRPPPQSHTHTRCS